MTKDLLLEIGVEELPADYMHNVINQLKKTVPEKLTTHRISIGETNIYATPRRLIIHVQNLALKQADTLIENRGPKKEIAFDENGEPTKAILGFARGQKVEVKDLEIREVSGAEYLFAVKKEKGKKTIEILPELLKELILNLSFPKSMRWGSYQIRFARPIRWLLALYGEEVINFSLENLTSSNITYGHRFLSAGKLEVANVKSYFELLEDNYVIYDQDKRKDLIAQQMRETASRVGGIPLENDKLLNEITYLLEYPSVFYGEFSPSYLALPVEVLTTSMIEHQRYFPLFDDKGDLLSGFMGVRNGTNKNIDIVKSGNEKVLKARLEDALFFWEEDTKISLEDMVDKLANVLFHEKLGSLLEKVERIEKIALYIGKNYNLSNDELLSRAAKLCKADLVSNMVQEFPELQGTMGRYYALQSNENEEVAAAIFEHYLPRFSGDSLPVTATGNLLSIAEKIDNLVGCFAIGIKPTGSQDPYALRRQAIGLVNILLENNIELDLPDILKYAYQTFDPANFINDINTTVDEVYDFILLRLKGVMTDRNLPYDVIDAVLAIPNNNVKEIVLKTEVLSAYRKTPSFADFMVVFNRTNNLSKNWTESDFNLELLEADSEIALNSAFNKIKDDVIDLFATGDYHIGLETLAGLREKIDEFFAEVMVMVDEEDLKAARLGLLKGIAGLCLLFADFNKILI